MSDEASNPRVRIYQVDRHRGPDPMMRRLLIIACGLSVALVTIVVLWSSVDRPAGPVPVVQADTRPFRVKPENPGGMVIPGLNTDLGLADASATSDKLAPPPETPDPQALQTMSDASAPAPAATPNPPAASTAGPASPGPRQAALPQVAATPPTPAPTMPASVAPLARTTPVGSASAPPRPLASATVGVAQREEPLSPTAVRPVSVDPAADGSDDVMPERRRPAATMSASLGRTQVQLAALATETAARHEWERLVHRMPDLFGAHHPVFSQTEHDGRRLWRLRTGDFASRAEATEFCQQVRAKGGGCAVATF